MLHTWDFIQITEDSNKHFQFIKPIWATFHFNGTIYFWEGIIRGRVKPRHCVNLTVFISFKSRLPSFCLGPFQWTEEPDQAPRILCLVDFGHVFQTNSSILNTFLSLHVLTEFGGGGHKSSGWDWQSCPQSLGLTRSGCKVAVDGATPQSRGLSGFGDNDIAASIKIHINHFTTRPHFPLC